MRALDVGRLRQAISGPGADTRTWIALGRVLERDDAIRCLGHDKAEQRGVLDEYIKLRDGHAGI